MKVYIYADLVHLVHKQASVIIEDCEVCSSKAGGWVVNKDNLEYVFPANTMMIIEYEKEY